MFSASPAHTFYLNKIAPIINSHFEDALKDHDAIIQTNGLTYAPTTDPKAYAGQAVKKLHALLESINDLDIVESFLKYFMDLKMAGHQVTFGDSPDVYLKTYGDVLTKKEQTMLSQTVEPLRTAANFYEMSYQYLTNQLRYVKRSVYTPRSDVSTLLHACVERILPMKQHEHEQPVTDCTKQTPQHEARLVRRELNEVLGEVVISWQLIKMKYNIGQDSSSAEEPSRIQKLITELGRCIALTDWESPDHNHMEMIRDYLVSYRTSMTDNGEPYPYTLSHPAVSANNPMVFTATACVPEGESLDNIADPILTFYQCVVAPWQCLLDREADKKDSEKAALCDEVFDLLIVYFTRQRLSLLAEKDHDPKMYTELLRAEFVIRSFGRNLYLADQHEVTQLKRLLSPECAQNNDRVSIFTQISYAPMFRKDLNLRYQIEKKYDALLNSITAWTFAAVDVLKNQDESKDLVVNDELKRLVNLDWFILRNNTTLGDYLERGLTVLKSDSLSSDSKLKGVVHTVNVVTSALSDTDFSKVPHGECEEPSSEAEEDTAKVKDQTVLWERISMDAQRALMSYLQDMRTSTIYDGVRRSLTQIIDLLAGTDLALKELETAQVFHVVNSKYLLPTGWFVNYLNMLTLITSQYKTDTTALVRLRGLVDSIYKRWLY